MRWSGRLRPKCPARQPHGFGNRRHAAQATQVSAYANWLVARRMDMPFRSNRRRIRRAPPARRDTRQPTPNLPAPITTSEGSSLGSRVSLIGPGAVVMERLPQ